MAERRMLSKKVVFSDKFYRLSDKAKLLYTYLVLDADDDGFVGNVRQTISATGANMRTLIQLAEHGFILTFKSGVVAISHWKMQNRIEKRMYTPTIYKDELDMLIVDRNGVYDYR